MSVVYVHPFVEPGVLRVSDAALAKLREHAKECRLWPRDVPRLPTITWYDGNRIRTPGTNEWQELGPGLMLGWSETLKVPANCVHSVDGFEFAVEMFPHVYEQAKERLIDRDDTAPTGFVLR